MFVDKVGRGEEKSPESQSETTGLLKPPDAGGNLPRSPSSEAVQKVRVSAGALSIVNKGGRSVDKFATVELTILATVDVPWQKNRKNPAKFRVWTRFQREVHAYLGDTRVS